MPEHDVVVVGGGVAGLRAALTAKETGVDVAVVSKLHPVRSHSAGTRAGLNAALDPADSWEQHAADTVYAGDYLGDQERIELLCREAPAEIVALDHQGALFNRDTEKRLQLRRLPGSRVPRSGFIDDLTGHVVLQVLYEQILKAQIPTYDEWFVFELLLDDGVCRGVVALDLRRGALQPLYAKAVVLATGHAAQVYAGSAASAACTGDGIALAYRAGAALLDMEMVQYHPLTIGQRRAVPLTRALLGVGAHLLNGAKERFLAAEAPQYGELAALDVCVRAIQREIDAGRGLDGAVLLDASGVETALLQRQFTETLSLAKTLSGRDLTREPVLVRPAVQATLGGIAVTADGATAVPGLFAAGACANVGIRGAGELAGNALMESLVFARRAGRAAAEAARQAPAGRAPEALVRAAEQRLQEVLERDGNADTPARLRAELGTLMHTHAGLWRDAAGLVQATTQLGALQQRYARLGLVNKQLVFNGELVAYFELGALLQVAAAILAAAAARQESRGFHGRRDFPARDDTQWGRHTLVTITPEGPSVAYRPVQHTRWQPQRRAY